MTRHNSDLDVCTTCGRPLNDDEDFLCGPCMSRRMDDLFDPTNDDLARRDAMIERGWRMLTAVVLGEPERKAS